MANVKIPNIYLASETLPDGSFNPVISLVETATRFQIPLKVVDGDNRQYEGITDFRFLPFTITKNLLLVPGIVITEYPLFAYCSEAQLDLACPDVLPGYENKTLKEWLAGRVFTTQLLTNGQQGFGLPNIVSFEQGVALSNVSGFTVVDQPTYISLLATEDI